MMDKITRGRVPVGAACIGVVWFLDYITKLWALYALSGFRVIPVLPFLEFRLAWNTGVSFSLFDSLGSYGYLVLSGVSLLVCFVFMCWYWREKVFVVRLALLMVVAGALGNVTDRLRYGAVIDFIHLHYQGFSWPIFNIADCFITIGIALIILHTLWWNKD